MQMFRTPVSPALVRTSVALWLLSGLADVQAQVVSPPMAVAMVGVCGGHACMAALPASAAVAVSVQPQAKPPKSPKPLKSAKSRNRLTRRST